MQNDTLLTPEGLEALRTEAPMPFAHDGGFVSPSTLGAGLIVPGA